MAYVKHQWETLEKITADRLNHIEDGISEALGKAAEVDGVKGSIDDIKHLKNVTEINSGYKHPGTVSNSGVIQGSTNNAYYVILGSDLESEDIGYFDCGGYAGSKLVVSMDPTNTKSVTVFFCTGKPSTVISCPSFTESDEITIPDNAKYIAIGAVADHYSGTGIPDSQNSTSVRIESVLFSEYLDTTLTESDYAPSSKAVGDAITAISSRSSKDAQEIKDDVDMLSSGNQMLDIVAARKEIAPEFEGFSVGYSVGTNGVIGATTNKRYFAFKTSPVLKYNISSCTKIKITFTPAYVQNIRYAFSSTADSVTLVGDVVTVNTADIPGQSEIVVNIPDGAKYINVGGYGTSTANAALAAESTYVYGVCSYFIGKMDDTLTAEDKPAQAKAAGDRIAALETLNDTTGVRRLRLTVNDYNIPFSVKTGQTNLYLGYGSGGDNTEDRTGDTEWARDNGFYNTAVGVQAFANNVDGDHCTAVGFTCLKSNTTGDFNTCVGEDALFGNTTGSNNIAIGDHAGQNNNGDNNILIGARVMRPATSASNNIIIGKESGSVLDTGGNNIIIGNGLNPVSDSSNNLIIGNSSIANIVIAGKVINFNQDGTVTWSNLS